MCAQQKKAVVCLMLSLLFLSGLSRSEWVLVGVLISTGGPLVMDSPCPRKQHNRPRCIRSASKTSRARQASSMSNDFRFAMMSTKCKPTWRHSNWNGVADPQRKLAILKPGKWSLLLDSRISLYGHDAKSLKNFTLHFDMRSSLKVQTDHGSEKCGSL